MLVHINRGRLKRKKKSVKQGETKADSCVVKIHGKRPMALALVAVLVGTCAAGGVAYKMRGESLMTVAEGDWGLSFQNQGEVPIGNVEAGYLKDFNAFYFDSNCASGSGLNKNEKEKTAYLTFDAGYENGYTNDILDVLKKQKVPATFFLVGNYFKDEPSIVKRMVNEGHIVGNHAMTHPNMSAISNVDDFKNELTGVEKSYEEIIGKPMKKFYRPPQGKFSEVNLKQAKDLGYTTVFWSLAYMDWLNDDQPTRENALNKLVPRMHNGAIILLHTTSKTNSLILNEFLELMKSEGYEFKTVEELGK